MNVSITSAMALAVGEALVGPLSFVADMGPCPAIGELICLASVRYVPGSVLDDSNGEPSGISTWVRGGTAMDPPKHTLCTIVLTILLSPRRLLTTPHYPPHSL